MRTSIKTLLSTLLLLLTLSTLHAGTDKVKRQHFFNTNIDYELNAHFSIGGSAPMGMPVEIRSIEKYNPNLQVGLGVHATKWLSDNTDWGVRLGVSAAKLGMETRSRVRNYETEVLIDNGYMKGIFTGHEGSKGGLVETHVENTYLTFPLSLVYRLSSRWSLYGGAHVAFTLNSRFDGFVSDGKFYENGDMSSEPVVFTKDGEASYDFSDEIRKTQWGVQVGGEYRYKKHLIFFSHLDYDINNLFKSDFKSISFSLHNIYLNLGFGYRF